MFAIHRPLTLITVELYDRVVHVSMTSAIHERAYSGSAYMMSERVKTKGAEIKECLAAKTIGMVFQLSELDLYRKNLRR